MFPGGSQWSLFIKCRTMEDYLRNMGLFDVNVASMKFQSLHLLLPLMGHKKTYSDHLELFSKSFLVQNIREWWSLGVILGQVRTGLAAQESPQSSFEVPLSILQFLSLYKNIESLPRNVDSEVRSYFRDDSTNQRFIVLGQANKISTHSE